MQTHFNAFLRYLEKRDASAMCVTPFAASRAVVYPTFAIRRLIDPISGAASVWWYRKWHGYFLEVALAEQLRNARAPVVVYAQCPVSAHAALRARRSPEQHVVMVAHFNRSQADEWAERGKVRAGGALYDRMRAFEESTLPLLDGIVYVSDFMRDELEARIPSLRWIRSAVIPNFVEQVPASLTREVCGDLVSVGTLEPRKNQGYLLEVVSAAARLGHRYTLALIGDGPDRSALEQQARRLGVRDQVHFLGFQPHAERLLPGYRALCHAARNENLAIALLEAMSHGLPVLAPAVGGTPELLRDGVEGAFWPLDEPLTAARVLIDLLEDDAKLEAMAAAGRQRVEEEFTAEVIGRRLARFLYGE